MILRKYMSLLGIGSAKVDLILEKDIYRQGDDVKGYFLIKGGIIAQQLTRIDCDLVMRDKEKNHQEIIGSFTILTTESIQSEAENKIPFTYKLPDDSKLSSETLTYCFVTTLGFSKGVESLDEDEIKIVE